MFRSSEHPQVRYLAELAEALSRVPAVSEAEVRTCVESLAESRGEEPHLHSNGSLKERILTATEDLPFLCHPGPRRSCAGCCDDFGRSRDELKKKYRRRRSLYLELVGGRKGFSRYRRRVRALEPDEEGCVYVAFLDDREETVGCLLHPRHPVNDGVDLRNHGKYGRPFCEAYSCAALKTLREASAGERLIFFYLQSGCEDWYSYSRLFSPFVSHLYHRGLVEIYLDHLSPERLWGPLDLRSGAA